MGCAPFGSGRVLVGGGLSPRRQRAWRCSFRVAVGVVWRWVQPQVSARMAVLLSGCGGWWCGGGVSPRCRCAWRCPFWVGSGVVWWSGSAPGVVAHGGAPFGSGWVVVWWWVQPQVSVRMAVLLSGRGGVVWVGVSPRCRRAWGVLLSGSGGIWCGSGLSPSCQHAWGVLLSGDRMSRRVRFSSSRQRALACSLRGWAGGGAEGEFQPSTRMNPSSRVGLALQSGYRRASGKRVPNVRDAGNCLLGIISLCRQALDLLRALDDRHPCRPVASRLTLGIVEATSREMRQRPASRVLVWPLAAEEVPMQLSLIAALRGGRMPCGRGPSGICPVWLAARRDAHDRHATAAAIGVASGHLPHRGP